METLEELQQELDVKNMRLTFLLAQAKKRSKHQISKGQVTCGDSSTINALFDEVRILNRKVREAYYAKRNS